MRPGGTPEKEWQKAGWSREPRNGYEWKRLKAGKPQPDERERRWRKPYKCKRHGRTPYKVVMINGRAARACVLCTSVKHRRHYEKNIKKYRAQSAAWRKRIQLLKPIREDGVATVPGTWLHYHVLSVSEFLKDGPIVVELYGEPAYMIVPLNWKGWR